MSTSGLVFSTDLRVTQDFAEKVAQRLYVRFNTTIDTWFMNLNFGIDWFGKIFGKGRTKNAIDTVIRNEILKEKYVSRIISFNSQLVNRVYTCDFEAKCVDLDTTVKIYFILNQNGLIIKTQDGLALTIAR